MRCEMRDVGQKNLSQEITDLISQITPQTSLINKGGHC